MKYVYPIPDASLFELQRKTTQDFLSLAYTSLLIFIDQHIDQADSHFFYLIKDETQAEV